MPWAGQEDAEANDNNCDKVNLENRARITTIEVFGEEDSYVTGIALIYDDAEKAETLIGSTLITSISIEIPDESNFMGIFGVANNTITELGVIVQDTACTTEEDDDIIIEDEI